MDDDWRSIPCSDIDWDRVPGIPRRVANRIHFSEFGKGQTLGQVADDGELNWLRHLNIGPVTIPWIKLAIDHAAAGTDLIEEPGSARVPYIPRPIPGASE